MMDSTTQNTKKNVLNPSTIDLCNRDVLVLVSNGLDMNQGGVELEAHQPVLYRYSWCWDGQDPVVPHCGFSEAANTRH